MESRIILSMITTLGKEGQTVPKKSVNIFLETMLGMKIEKWGLEIKLTEGKSSNG